jgi:heme/copper-type cytochrome/quinol oxidase subunit 2
MPYDSSSSGQGLAAILGAGLIIYLVISLVLLVFAVIVWWKIFSKAGYSGAMGLLMFVPIANLIVLLMLAFAEWPILRELKALRQNQARGPMPMYSAPPNPQLATYQQNPQFPSNPSNPSYPQNPQYPRQ